MLSQQCDISLFSVQLLLKPLAQKQLLVLAQLRSLHVGEIEGFSLDTFCLYTEQEVSLPAHISLKVSEKFLPLLQEYATQRVLPGFLDPYSFIHPLNKLFFMI